MRHVRLVSISLLAVFALANAGCSSFAPPKAWERGDLAKPSMQFDPDPLEARYRDHIYTSKEGSFGGYGAGGGGCGCN